MFFHFPMNSLLCLRMRGFFVKYVGRARRVMMDWDSLDILCDTLFVLVVDVILDTLV